MGQKKSKIIYVCQTSWNHEIDHTDALIYPKQSLIQHQGCGIAKCRITFLKVVKKEDLSAKNWIPIGMMKHVRLKSLRERISQLKKEYKEMLKKKENL